MLPEILGENRKMHLINNHIFSLNKKSQLLAVISEPANPLFGLPNGQKITNLVETASYVWQHCCLPCFSHVFCFC
jgi:hypothetical protein